MTDRIQILTAGSEGRRPIHETFNSYTGSHNDDDSGCILWVCRKERRTERCESAGEVEESVEPEASAEHGEAL